MSTKDFPKNRVHQYGKFFDWIHQVSRTGHHCWPVADLARHVGVSDAFTPNSKDAAAMVGDNKIKLRDFDRSFQLRLRNENEQTTERMSIRQAIARGLHRDVLNQMITNELVSIDADDLGVDVNRRDAREFVESLGIYNNAITGKYDEKSCGTFCPVRTAV